MFISPAFAQAGGDVAGAGAGIMQFLPLILIFVVFYFLLIRPQQKKMKQHKEMLAAIRRGDRIVTAGGIEGSVSKVVDDNVLLVDIAENVRVKVHKAMVSTVLSKPEAAPATGPAVEPANDATPGPIKPPTKSPTQAKNSGFKNLLGGKKDQ